MTTMPIDSFSKLFQFSISPIALISGASLLLLSLTNRLGRTIDRTRFLVRELEAGGHFLNRGDHKSQLRILMRRSHYLKWAILCLCSSVFLSAVMIMSVFLHVFAGWEIKTVVLGLLFTSILAIGVAVVLMVVDVSAGLKALHLEVDRHV